MADDDQQQPNPDDGKPDQGKPGDKPDADRKDDAPSEDVTKLKTALDRERSLRRAAEKEARENAAHKQRADELEAATQSDTEKAVSAARREGAQEAIASANKRVVNAEARALAAEHGFRNPALAVRAIDLGDVKVTDDGTVDVDAIKASFAALATAEPYLLKADDAPRTPKPDPSQGGTGRPPANSDADRGLAEAARRFGKPT